MITARRAAAISALVAAVLYAPSVRNQFALDDHAIIRGNPRTHGFGAALRAFNKRYWPPEKEAGLWRPLTVLSFGLDWSAGGGSPHWMHATNVVLHAGATAVVTAFIAPYVGAAGALAGGVLFAVHPLHVEAVANIVGRAEMLAALAVLGALLLARIAVRRREAGRSSTAAEFGLVGCLIAGLLSKEHAVVTIALLLLDDLARSPTSRPRLPWRSYAIVALVSVAWFLVRSAIDGGRSFRAMAPAFYGLDTVGRLSTMLPVALTVLRLSFWPMDLSLDYHPQVIARHHTPDPIGLFALVVLVALGILTALCWRRQRVVSVAVLLFVIAWAPTSNVLFPSGIVLSERTLYLSSVGLALLAGLAVNSVLSTRFRRHALVLGVALALLFAARSWSRIPLWYGSREVVLNALEERPESYMAHMAAGRVYSNMRDYPRALAAFGVAAELYPNDHLAMTEAGIIAMQAGRLDLAERFLRLAVRARPSWALPDSLLEEVLRLRAAASQPSK